MYQKFFSIGLTQVVAFILLLSIKKIHGEEKHHCVWYKACGEVGRGTVNCAYNGTGKPLTNKESQDTMYDLCPELYTNRKWFSDQHKSITLNK